jgi:phosphoenolpyruvate carboxylase
MNKIQEMNECGRGEQLVAYLYGESNADERAGFERHLSACVACSEELAAFGQVREAVGAWRAELLTHAPAFATAELMPAVSASRAASVATERRTAWGALREFFALSPAWLRYGSVTAALVVCALAALAVANAQVRYENGSFAFSTGLARTTISSSPVPQTANAGDIAPLDQLVAERDAAVRELQETRAQLDDSRAANIEAVYHEIDDSQPADAVQTAPSVDPSTRQRRSAGAQRKSARRATQGEDDLPRLIDLLGSGN